MHIEELISKIKTRKSPRKLKRNDEEEHVEKEVDEQKETIITIKVLNLCWA